MKKIFVILFLSIFLYPQSDFAQSNISAKLSTVSGVFGSLDNSSLYHNTIDSKGILALEPGLILSYESFFDEKIAFQFSTGLFSDRAKMLSGYSQMTFRYRFFKLWKQSAYIGLGPAFHYRQTWENIENYVPEEFYNSNSNMQTQMSFLSAELTYRYFLTKTTDFVAEINHTQARGISISLGFKYWIGKKPRSGRKKGCDCPSYK